MQTANTEKQLTMQIEIGEKQRTHIKRVYDAAKKTLELLAFLDAEDFKVLGMEISGHRSKPIVHIQNVSRCGWLKSKHNAYTFGQRPGPYGAEIIWRCDLLDCRVQWVERGH
jgi:hypothetical protein